MDIEPNDTSTMSTCRLTSKQTSIKSKVARSNANLSRFVQLSTGRSCIKTSRGTCSFPSYYELGSPRQPLDASESCSSPHKLGSEVANPNGYFINVFNNYFQYVHDIKSKQEINLELQVAVNCLIW
ncbi:hypothetical protein CUMW_186950 [Citrus unshiu]|nr:hypothetical protein CUMW_186950 [Citrus unshiu]